MGLEEADYGVTDMALGRNSQAGDESLLVKFYRHPMQNAAKTLEEGRPIFEEKDFIEIMIPGNKDNIIQRPASQMDVNRFPRHYQAYKARMSQDAIEGTLLEEWPGITRGQVEEFKFMNVRTVEQLAGMADNLAQKFQGINQIREKAKAYLLAAKDQASSSVLEETKVQLEAQKAENAKMQDRLAALEKALANTVTAEFEQVEVAPKRRGRPPAALIEE